MTAQFIPNPDYLIGRDDLLQQIEARLQQEQADITLFFGFASDGYSTPAFGNTVWSAR
jgi:hypothetical protein